MARSFAPIVLLGLVLAACGSPAPSISAAPSGQPTMPLGTPPSSQPPIAEPSAPSTSTQSAPPADSDPITADTYARVVTDDLRVRSKPGLSEGSKKLEPLLDRGALLVVLDGPVQVSGPSLHPAWSPEVDF
jgi:hypothetical protein